jgi:hypothetical protein
MIKCLLYKHQPAVAMHQGKSWLHWWSF